MAALLNFLKRRGNKSPQKTEFEGAAVDLHARADRLRGGVDAYGIGFTTDTTLSTAELIESLAIFVKTLGSASAAADRATKVIFWLTVVGVFIAVTNAVLVVVQIVETDRAINTQNAIAFNTTVFHDTGNQQIIAAIESHKPILIENHGRSTSTQLDSYLGDLETLDSTYTKRQITEEELCDSYSVTITETFNNPEIKKYLHDYPDYFAGAVELAGIVKKSKLEDCH